MLRSTDIKLLKNYVFEEHHGHAALNELARHAPRRKWHPKSLAIFIFGVSFTQKGIWYGDICHATLLQLKWRRDEEEEEEQERGGGEGSGGGGSGGGGGGRREKGRGGEEGEERGTSELTLYTPTPDRPPLAASTGN